MHTVTLARSPRSNAQVCFGLAYLVDTEALQVDFCTILFRYSCIMHTNGEVLGQLGLYTYIHTYPIQLQYNPQFLPYAYGSLALTYILGSLRDLNSKRVNPARVPGQFKRRSQRYSLSTYQCL
jgi:hypothetical protein